MHVPVLLLAIATLLCAHIAMAMPAEPSSKASPCKAADAMLVAPCALRAGRPAGRRPHLHMAFAWLIHQASMGNLDPIVKGILTEAKKQLRSEFPSFFPVTFLVPAAARPFGRFDAILDCDAVAKS
jgi:hypothetical protein